MFRALNRGGIAVQAEDHTIAPDRLGNQTRMASSSQRPVYDRLARSGRKPLQDLGSEHGNVGRIVHIGSNQEIANDPGCVRAPHWVVLAIRVSPKN